MPMGEDSEKKNPPGNSKEGNYAGGGGIVCLVLEADAG